jgi:hypothetical protein
MANDSRQLDAEVAEVVMGWTSVEMFCNALHGYKPTGAYGRVSYYSSDIAAAWAVVEKMVADGWEAEFYGLQEMAPDTWYCSLGTHGHGDLYGSYEGRAETAPQAICKAAVAAAKELGKT